MKYNACPMCRRAMRLWALDWRRALPAETRHLALRTATSFRDECLHNDRAKFNALVDKIADLNSRGRYANTSYPLLLQVWGEAERIKNLHDGMPPQGVTFRAWQPATGEAVAA